ncbi:MAG: alpha/beta hydrolase-fold protein [Bacteroidota bacterium]
MKNLFTFLSVCFNVSFLAAQSNYTLSSIPGPKVDSLYSEIVGDDYRLLITLPFGFSPEKQKYPVLYYLDALGSSGMMNELAQIKMYSGSFDPVILVGLSYETNPMAYGQLRNRDYLPPINETDIAKGGDEFLQFIKSELIPYMENNYSADPENRGLMGFSAGGLFTTWAFKEEPSLFQKLAIISPSLWYDEAYLFEDEALLNAIKNADDLKVLITCGSLEGNTMVSHTDRLFELVQENKNIQSAKVIFEGETHGSVSTAAMARGLYFLYENQYKVFKKQGKAYYKAQAYAKSLEQFEMAFEASPRQVDENDRYNISCLYALTGDSDKAIQQLQAIANSGFNEYEYLLQDTDLNSLHEDERWEDLINLVKRNKETAVTN